MGLPQAGRAPDLQDIIDGLLTRLPTEIDRSRQVYSNRDVDLAEIDSIGFDMDYTLALYRQDRMDELAVDKTLERLVAERHYPSSIMKLSFDPEFAIRGLLIDKLHGNVLKVDAGRHVVKAYHGFQPVEDLSQYTYHREAVRIDPHRFHLIDTLFALPEVGLFAAMVEHFEREGRKVDFAQVFTDIRYCIDLAHRDGSLKAAILGDLDKYVVRDDRLAPTLHKFRSAGKQLFLMTNSLHDYTDRVMEHLLDGQTGTYSSWRHYFDVVITGARKPTFFTGEDPFLELDDHGRKRREVDGPLVRGVIYQGGNLRHFEKQATAVGHRVLYVGDHIYGDILKSKKTSAWTTCMLVQEMSSELQSADTLRNEVARLRALEEEDHRLSEELAYERHFLHRLEQIVKLMDPTAAPSDSQMTPETEAELTDSIRRLRQSTQRMKARRQALVAELVALDRELESRINPYWGPIFQARNELSIFGSQVNLFADLYTSSVGNFVAYSPIQYFRARRALMPHEQ